MTMPAPDGAPFNAPEGTPLNTAPLNAPRPHTLLAMGAQIHRQLLADAETETALSRLHTVAQADTTTAVTDLTTTDPRELASAEVLFTHWGAPLLTEEALTLMPRLRAVVHAAGSVKHHVTDAVWRRGIAVSSAAAANALPVAEFTLAAILFAGKRVLDVAHTYAATRTRPDLLPYYSGHGNYHRTVGIVGASRIGRRVIELLRPFDLDVLLHDPYVDAHRARALGVKPAGLDELVRHSDVVSIHAPQLPETHHMFDTRRLALMKDGATLVNTARGDLVDTDALTAHLVTGRLHAVLDVTEPDVPPADSPLYTLPNVLLTPHIAGSLGNELGRMTDWAVDEVARYAQGLPLAHEVAPDELIRSA
ncbi:2-hydroxyacid family dehydrogenase [Streptomyces davaonensis JCM 4913]|uniref:2-hydroxyacid family dehydrogenase n=2 Tax=Streptomyces davaonensis TaxID=348043 RepID=K4QYA5_STRDJ|nr:2-hydroxyacid family dehydrogenase [Streptomyces davaonensis JCM 4913]